MAVLGFIVLALFLTFLGLLLKGGIKLVTQVLVWTIQAAGVVLGWILSGIVWLAFQAWAGIAALYRLAREKRQRANDERRAATQPSAPR